MISIIRKRIYLILIVIILLLGFLLRFHNLYSYPRLGSTFDEYAWTWLGISLIQTGTPTSWSYHPQYENRHEIKYQTVPFVLVTPYLEHPPLFGIIAGSFALLSGVEHMFDITLYELRGLSLILGLITILLVYFLSTRLYGKKIAIIAALLYATIPTIVLGSRILQNENFFVPMWLLSLLLIVEYLNNKKKTLRNIAFLLCGLLILSKIPWIAASFSIGIILLYNKKYRDIFFLFVTTCIAFIAFFIYGIYFERNTFFSLWALQLNRYDITFASIYALFQKPFLADRYFLDGWIFFGWLAFILACLKDFKKNLIIISALLSYFLIYVAGIPDEAGHGWYRYPFYPFLVISTALFIKEFFNKNYILTFLFLVFIGTALFEVTWAVAFGFSFIVFRIALISWGLVLIPQYLPNGFTKRVSITTSYFWLFAFVLMSIWSILSYTEQ